MFDEDEYGYDQEPEETDATEETKNVINVTFDLDAWMTGESVLGRIEERVCQLICKRYEDEVKKAVMKQVEDLVRESVSLYVDKCVSDRLNAPVVKTDWEGNVTEETPMLDYLSDQFTKHLKANDRRYDREPRFEKWVSDEVIIGLDKRVKAILSELRDQAEAAVKDKVKELLADYISTHWKPHPLPPLLEDK